jgi:hypothetical protein
LCVCVCVCVPIMDAYLRRTTDQEDAKSEKAV